MSIVKNKFFPFLSEDEDIGKILKIILYVAIVMRDLYLNTSK